MAERWQELAATWNLTGVPEYLGSVALPLFDRGQQRQGNLTVAKYSQGLVVGARVQERAHLQRHGQDAVITAALTPGSIAVACHRKRWYPAGRVVSCPEACPSTLITSKSLVISATDGALLEYPFRLPADEEDAAIVRSRLMDKLRLLQEAPPAADIFAEGTVAGSRMAREKLLAHAIASPLQQVIVGAHMSIRP